MSEPLLEVRDLHVSFGTYEGEARVINGVDLSIDPGETQALVGESGCGKSVTAKAILGLLTNVGNAEIGSGEILFKGENLLDLSQREWHRRRGEEMSMILQDPMTSLNPVFTVGEQMLDLMKWQGRSNIGLVEYFRDKFNGKSELRAEAIEMLDRVQISAPERVFSSYPVELSGGMRQRVLIAMALLSEPDFLIADEPGTAIDVTTESKILSLMNDLVEETDASILYITHDLGVAKEVSETIQVMYAGEIVERAPTQDLFAAPQHPYTRGLLDSIPQLSNGIGKSIEGQLPDYTDPPAACRFKDRCPHAQPACGEVFPYPRKTGEAHEVGCHLYHGEPSYPRHGELASNNDIDIGEPPWVDAGPASNSSPTSER
jgi:peptide/nickel transport system ATP-binding protein